MINSAFCAYDNVNEMNGKTKELACSNSTGMKFVRRELYTTAQQVTYESQATIAFTGVTSPFDQVEHSNRSLVLKIKGREQCSEGAYVGASDLLKDLDGHRDEIMSEIVSRVQLVLDALDAEKDYVPRSNLRLADIAAVVLRTARHEGWENKAKQTLDAWVAEQAGSSLEDDEWGPLMVRAIRETNFQSSWMPASEFKVYLLDKGFRGVSDDIRRMKPASVSAELIRNKSAYANRYGLEIKADTHSKVNMFRLNPSKEIISYFRSTAPKVPGEISFEPVREAV
jgi:hypothetical protein